MSNVLCTHGQIFAAVLHFRLRTIWNSLYAPALCLPMWGVVVVRVSFVSPIRKWWLAEDNRDSCCWSAFLCHSRCTLAWVLNIIFFVAITSANYWRVGNSPQSLVLTICEPGALYTLLIREWTESSFAMVGIDEIKTGFHYLQLMLYNNEENYLKREAVIFDFCFTESFI